MSEKARKPALLIIDMINSFDFDHGPTLAEKTFVITDPILKLKQTFNKRELPVIFINDHYNLWKADFEKIIEHCRNELSSPIFKKLIPHDDDYFLIKPKHSAFYGTALNTLLRQLRVDTLILTGIAGNICVLFTANDAYMREYHLVIPEDCIASNNDQDNDYTLKMMRNVLGANTNKSTEQNF
ncbi:isochorismatase family cysteine hydrolase [Mesobacillus harenae]|uniref:isochorismatase family cysteine hydrolase n=1 Tax=Mesobacillus harenae TaxID=2213203 RepID=UPI002410E546|nr:isochorismatase family cysteine hydrolase [Mesobacillus harenae]